MSDFVRTWSNHGGRWHQKPPMERFWEKVEKTDGCWIWRGGRDRAGYGLFHLGQRSLRAHRYVLELEGRPARPDQYVCHHCDNPPCVRPDHLFIGTNSDNQRDSYLKGRACWSRRIYKPTCKHGHPWSEANTRHTPNGRQCRACDVIRTRKYVESHR